MRVYAFGVAIGNVTWLGQFSGMIPIDVTIGLFCSVLANQTVRLMLQKEGRKNSPNFANDSSGQFRPGVGRHSLRILDPTERVFG